MIRSEGYCYDHHHPEISECPRCRAWREHWTRWINPFGYSTLGEWYVRVCQLAFTLLVFNLPLYFFLTWLKANS